MVSLRMRNASVLAWQPLQREGELFLLPLQRDLLLLQVGDLGQDRRAADQRLPGQILAADAERLLRLGLQLAADCCS